MWQAITFVCGRQWLLLAAVGPPETTVREKRAKIISAEGESLVAAALGGVG
jgi:hypothetical protein